MTLYAALLYYPPDRYWLEPAEHHHLHALPHLPGAPSLVEERHSQVARTVEQIDLDQRQPSAVYAGGPSVEYVHRRPFH